MTQQLSGDDAKARVGWGCCTHCCCCWRLLSLRLLWLQLLLVAVWRWCSGGACLRAPSGVVAGSGRFVLQQLDSHVCLSIQPSVCSKAC